MDLEPIVSRPAEGRDQGWVNVDDLPVVSPHHPLAQNAQVPGQDDKADVMGLQHIQQGVVQRLLGGVIPAAEDGGLNAVLPGPLQGVSVLGGGDAQGDLPPGELPRPLGVDEGLEIGPPAGDKHCDV